MREQDVATFVELFHAVAAEGRWIATEAPFDRVAFAERVSATLADDARASFVAVDEANVVVGHLQMYTLPHAKRTREFGMVVAENMRGRGIGGALLDAAIADARANGAERIELGVFPDNDAAIRLHRSRGFADIGRRSAPLRRADGALREVRRMELVL